jgi:hypothetical protein
MSSAVLLQLARQREVGVIVVDGRKGMWKEEFLESLRTNEHETVSLR